MPPLPKDQRKLLETTVVAARDAAEEAARAALRALSVDRDEPHVGISSEDRALRVALRAQARQLGDFDLLVAQVAYEQWHRMLFARFLVENGLLMHPSGVAVTLEECADLAESEGEPDGWLLAARYAARMLPGIFPLESPSARIRFAKEGSAALEELLAGLPAALFRADDSLGWGYQFWQTKKKKEVNASERKIGGADLAPVTQLFTEHYMVAFLLENSLGAWWAARHPESPLLRDFEYLRFAEDGTTAAGGFEGWPDRVAEVTMMDPCCGSGHFLVTGFHMLRRMREEEEGLSSKEAADAVLRDNLFGLELDGRCVQIAVFALALEAWKVGGYRELPAMSIACSGIPARGTVQEWRKLARGDQRLESALDRLYYLFKDADTLGSLIDPRRAAAADELLGASYEEVEPLLHAALTRFGGEDPAQRVFAAAAEDVARAARLLAREYWLVATNVPYLQQKGQTEKLKSYLDIGFTVARADLATAMLQRSRGFLWEGGALALVTPQNWLTLGSYRVLREELVRRTTWHLVTRLDAGAFGAISGEVVKPVLFVMSEANVSSAHSFHALELDRDSGPREKAEALAEQPLVELRQTDQSLNPDTRIVMNPPDRSELLSRYASGYAGVQTGDYSRFGRCFWELRDIAGGWQRQQSTVPLTLPYGGRQHVLLWEDGRGSLYRFVCDRLGEAGVGAWLRGSEAWGKSGVAVSQMNTLSVTLYEGHLFDNNTAVIVCKEDHHVLPLWAFCSSPDFHRLVRRIDQKMNVTNSTMVKVPFDLDHWTKVAEEQYPDGLPEPHSDDPTQWLFKGNVVGAEAPLHVAVARLLGYSWPDQEPDDLDRFADSDGIVCLSPVAGERPAVDRLRELLAAAYGAEWSESLLERLLKEVAATDLETWLRDGFFQSHAKLFHNRPFIWQVWDGRKDGFSALLNYHNLGKQGLEKLTYKTLQWWIDRQHGEADAGTSGAPARLAAARGLQEKLGAILEGEPPYDIYVRWKPLAKQPLGWDPDLDDGVRLSIRPFVEAGVLRSRLTINWNKDRGKNPDGSERHNDLHFTVAEKLAARGGGAGT